MKLIVLRENAEQVLAEFTLHREENTRMSGPICILTYEALVVVAELPKPGELVLRPMKTIDDAEHFVRSRLDTYERMWDGCGCRIDYYH